MDEQQEIINEFLIESAENLSRLDEEMVELEQRPGDKALLASVFRTIHTIKGTCGFLGFDKLGAITHSAENILSQLRDGKRELTQDLTTLILESVDAIKAILRSIEGEGGEGINEYAELRTRLQAASQNKPAPATVAPPAAPVAEAPSAVDPAPALAEKVPEPAPVHAEEGTAALRPHGISESTIRVDVGLLDRLMNLVGELVLARNQILQFNAQHSDATLSATSQRLNLITTELQGGVMKTRMQPIGVVWNKLPRLVRDLSASFGKQIQIVMDGADTELDKTIIEAIKDPLTHIVRNVCDHGIERPEQRIAIGKPAQGKLTLRAFHEGGQVNIEIADDGAGINLERVKSKAIQRGQVHADQAERMSERELLNMVFLPGFSTAKEVTSVSGRGVGMDVVKTNIEKIGGTVDVVSQMGHGTTFKLKIPLTLAIIPGLVVTSTDGNRFVIPQVSLLELIRIEGDATRQIEWIHGTPVYRRRGNLLPIIYLNQVLGQGAPAENEVLNIVVLQAEDHEFGLVVDAINDTQEIVVKPLGKQLKSLTCYAGATIMGDGRVALILDVLGLSHLAGIVRGSRDQNRQSGDGRTTGEGERQAYLLFSAGSFSRLAVPLSLVARLEEIPQSKIEHAGGRRVVQYRGQILPLAPLGLLLDPCSDDTAGRQDPVQVLVFADHDRCIGIMVDRIVDIVDEAVSVRQRTDHAGLLGSAVIGKKITDLLDLRAVIDASGQHWFSESSEVAAGATVLVAESSAFARAMARTCLDMAGYRVMEAATAQEALRVLESERVDVVVAARGLTPHEGKTLGEQMRAMPGLAHIPVVELAAPGEEGAPAAAGELAERTAKFDHDAMLRSVARLAAAVGRRNEVPVPAGVKGEHE